MFSLGSGRLWTALSTGLRKTLPRRPAGALRCDTSLRLTPQHSVHSVSCGGRRWLVSCHPGGVTVVAEFGIPLDPASAGNSHQLEGVACSGSW